MIANMDSLESEREKFFNFSAFIFDNEKGDLKNLYKATILVWEQTSFPSVSQRFTLDLILN